MDNKNVYDAMNQMQRMAKTCNLARVTDLTVSELNWAIGSRRIEDKINELKKVFAQCENSICQASGIQNLSQWLIENHYFEQADIGRYNRDLIWLRDNIIPYIATQQLCNMMAEKTAEDRLRQMGCSPQLLMLLKAMFG